MRKYSFETGGFYVQGRHENIPADAVDITEQRYLELLIAIGAGQTIVRGPQGAPVAQPVPAAVPTDTQLCARIDQAADAARRAVAGDPLRAVEYDRAASEAQAFAASNYQGDVPPMVAAWAINGRTAQQAADDILREAALYNGALVQLRATRLQAKELIRAAMADGNVELAEDIAAETIASIEAAVAGIGNNA